MKQAAITRQGQYHRCRGKLWPTRRLQPAVDPKGAVGPIPARPAAAAPTERSTAYTGRVPTATTARSVRGIPATGTGRPGHPAVAVVPQAAGAGAVGSACSGPDCVDR